MYATRHSNHEFDLSLDSARSSFGQQLSTGSKGMSSYAPPTTARFAVTGNHRRTNSTGSTGAIEKTNMMSSENPFVDPARPYGQFSAARTITSITSPRKSEGALNKSLNLSDENPFHTIYGSYRYPAQVDPSKRITTQNTTPRSTDSKSLHMSEENPFNKIHDRYQPLTQSNAQKRFAELPRPAPSPPSSSLLLSGSSLSSNGLSLFSNGLSHSSSFNSYRPSLIRQYSAGDIGSEMSSVSNSIADWTRNNPAPLSYRPIHVQRPPQEYFSQNEPLYIPPSSPPRSQPPPLPPMSPRLAPAASVPAQPRKANPSAPPDKTSLNMSADNPFTATYGRYHYPSPDEIRTYKRENERTVRFADEVVVNESRPVQPPSQTAPPAEIERQETNTSKGKTKAARFDITF